MRPYVLLTLALCGMFASAQSSQKDTPLTTVAARTSQMRAMPGLLPLYWDQAAGKLYLEIPTLDHDLLYTHSLPFGTGSNDLGLDRGQTSEGVVVRFERFGPKVLLVEANQAFRSSSTDPAEQLSVRQSFPESVLAGFKVEATDLSGAVLVDATDFFVRDAHSVIEILSGLKQGSYKLDGMRSAIALDRTRAFPKNTEVEALLTFTTDSRPEGEFVGNVTPNPHAITLREHQSFLELPGPGFAPRRFDPRAGYFPMSYRDYSAPLGAPLDQQFILRHRLNKKDPACRRACEAETPIQYYVDRGAPEPIRSALVEGARWWDQAFQAAGWAPGTFRVDVLPSGADPMDIRFNIIQWVHRYTRGWSYGAAIADPRTGEIIKGNVTLGSLRGRQDYLIAEALLSPYGVRKESPLPAQDPMLQMVLARIRQLAAHETGHTLGLSHNFAASATSQSTSVMDYPHPYITLGKDGVPDLSQAYAINIGQWDKVAIDYGYRQFPARSNEHDELNKILAASQAAGLVYITDEDARPLGGAHPHAHLWDNGPDPADELIRILDIRKAALARFGEGAIRPGASLAQLEDTLVPLYLLHRYQTEAAIKEIGGLEYRYSLRGDGQPTPEIVAPAQQQKAIAAVLKTLSPETLTLSETLLKLFPPRPPGLERTRESLPTHTGLTFDPIAAAESSADLTLRVLFHPQRANRMVEYHARNPGTPTLDELVERTLAATTAPSQSSAMTQLIGHALTYRVSEALLTLASSPETSNEARSIARKQLVKLSEQGLFKDRIDEFLKNPAKFEPAKQIEAPPGMPIGDRD